MKRTLILLSILAVATPLAAQPVGTVRIDLAPAHGGPRPIPTQIFYPGIFSGEGSPVAGPAGTRYPYVVFGRGRSIPVDAYRWLIDRIVRRGIIVAVPLTQGGTGFDMEAHGLELAGVSTSMRAEAHRNAGVLQGRIADRVAIGGHGFGAAAAIRGAWHDSLRALLFTIAPTVTDDTRILQLASRIASPMFAIAGTNDCIAPDSTNARRVFDVARSSCRSHVAIIGASHCQFPGIDLSCQISEAQCTVSPTISRNAQQATLDSILLPWLAWQLLDRCDGQRLFLAYTDSSRAITSTVLCDAPTIGMSHAPDDEATICPGDSLVLRAPSGYATYVWSTGATSDTIVVRSEGDYSVVARGGPTCDARSRPLRVRFGIDRPMIGGRMILCPGTSRRVGPAASDARYRWSTGDTTREIEITGPGFYWVTASNDRCAATSDTLEVVGIEQARIAVDGHLVGCAGDTVRLSGPGSARFTLWSTGATTRSIVVTAAGTYWLSVVDTNGCALTDTLVVTRHVAAPAMIIRNRDTLTSSPASAYQWQLDDVDIAGATGRRHIALRPGRYRVRTIDSNGCSALSAPVLVPLITAAPDEAVIGARVALRERMLVVELDATRPGPVRIVVVDARGAIVRTCLAASRDRITCDLAGLAAGRYIVAIERDGRRESLGGIVLQ